MLAETLVITPLNVLIVLGIIVAVVWLLKNL